MPAEIRNALAWVARNTRSAADLLKQLRRRMEAG
jgi:hypothetical protein